VIGLLDVELRRALSRRLIRIMTALAIVGVLVGGLVALAKSNRVPRTDVQSFTFEGIPMGECLAQQDIGLPGDPGSEERRIACEKIIQAQREEGQREFLRARDRRFFLTQLKDVLGGMTAPAVLVAILFGATLIGAEWRHGTVATTLTWEPRRVRLILAKLLAALIVSVVFYILIFGLLSFLLWLTAATRGTTAGAGQAFAREVVGQSLRGGLLVLFGCCMGFAFGGVARNTAAALGVGFGYVVIAEQILFGVLPWLRPWLVLPNAVILVRGSGFEELLGYTAMRAGIKIVAYGVGLILITIAVFRARDVTA
jgi:ABC-type transport system involved in multi-copper enzyme maturation permease subunit